MRPAFVGLKIPYAAFIELFYEYACNTSTFEAFNLSLSELSHVGSLFTKEEQNKFGS